MNQPAKYKLIAKQTVDDLNEAVNEALSRGCKLHGNPFSHQQFVCQAVIPTKTGSIEQPVITPGDTEQVVDAIEEQK